MKDKQKKVLACILAFVTCFSFEELLKVNNGSLVISNSVIAIFIFAVTYTFFQKYVLNVSDRRLQKVALVLGFLFALFLVCGSNILQHDSTRILEISTLFSVVGAIPLMAGTVMILLQNTCFIVNICKMPKVEAWIEQKITTRKSFVFSWLSIFFAWLPGLIASYPGMYGYDSVFQLGFYIDKKIDLWHPLAHTYLMGICIEDIGGVLGSREAGMCFYSILQMLFLSGCFALVVFYMTKKKAPIIIRIAMVVFAACLPTNAIMSFSCTKDIPFAGLMCILTYITMRIADDEMFLTIKRNWIAVIVVFCGLFAFRNQGIYVIILGLVFGCILLHKQWKRFVILLLTTVVLFCGYSGPFTNALNGVEASKGIEEMLSVPIMQISRAVCYGADELTETEIIMAEEYIPTVHEYDSRGDKGIADYFKEDFDSVRFKENPLEFIKLWGSIGVKKPLIYIDAFARLSIGLWYPDMNYRDPEAYHPYWEYENTPPIQEEWIILERSTPECLQWLADYYYDLSYNNTYQKYPVISMLFSGGFYVWLLFIYVAWCVYKKEYKLLFPASFLVFYWLTMLLGPVVIYRYLYPLIISLPILLTTMFTYKKEKN